jgi:hypothetical protein
MGWFTILLGLGVLGLAWYSYRDNESDTIFLLDWDWFWLDFDRSEHPILFWAALITEICVGIGLIITGVASL